MGELTIHHAGRGHFCATGRIADVAARFLREEEEGFVGLFVKFRNPDRTADGSAEVVVSLYRRRIRFSAGELRLLEEVSVRVKYVVADELERRAVQTAGSRLCDYVYLSVC